jgi:nucleotide-binding universal stress UspA family protein
LIIVCPFTPILAAADHSCQAYSSSQKTVSAATMRRRPGSPGSWIVRGGRPDAIIRVGSPASSEEDEMSIFPTRILLATDGSGEAELATRTAVDLAQMSDSELHVVHVLDASPSPALLYPDVTDPEGAEVPDQVLEQDLERRAEQRGREVLDAEAERVQSAGGTVAQTHLAMGDAPREIVHLAEDLEAGLIVMGSRGHGGIRRALMGSVSDSVVRHAHCPVLIVRA